jgi:hypothetical protein
MQSHCVADPQAPHAVMAILSRDLTRSATDLFFGAIFEPGRPRFRFQ